MRNIESDIPGIGGDSRLFVEDDAADEVNIDAPVKPAKKKPHAYRTLGTLGLLALVAAASPERTGSTPKSIDLPTLAQTIVERVSMFAARGALYLHEKQEGRPSGSLHGYADGYIGQSGACLDVQVNTVSTAPGSIGMTVTRQDGSRVIYRKYAVEPGFEQNKLVVCPQPGHAPLSESGVVMSLEALPAETAENP